MVSLSGLTFVASRPSLLSYSVAGTARPFAVSEGAYAVSPELLVPGLRRTVDLAAVGRFERCPAEPTLPERTGHNLTHMVVDARSSGGAHVYSMRAGGDLDSGYEAWGGSR